jgi:hypothetical protein
MYQILLSFMSILHEPCENVRINAVNQISKQMEITRIQPICTDNMEGHSHLLSSQLRKGL